MQGSIYRDHGLRKLPGMIHRHAGRELAGLPARVDQRIGLDHPTPCPAGTRPGGGLFPKTTGPPLVLGAAYVTADKHRASKGCWKPFTNLQDLYCGDRLNLRYGGISPNAYRFLADSANASNLVSWPPEVARQQGEATACGRQLGPELLAVVDSVVVNSAITGAAIMLTRAGSSAVADQDGAGVAADRPSDDQPAVGLNGERLTRGRDGGGHLPCGAEAAVQGAVGVIAD